MGRPQNLKMSCYCYLSGILLLSLLVVDCSDVNIEVKGNLEIKKNSLASENGTNYSNEQKGGANSGSNFMVGAQVEKEQQKESSKGVIQNDLVKNNVSIPLKSRLDKSRKVSIDSSSVSLKENAKDKESGNSTSSGEESDSEPGLTKDVTEETSSGSLVGLEKEKMRDEECDPSNMCVDEKKNVTACLRVPGNDSPDLSLLIQNKGNRPVTVMITAPAFVQLEETKVKLQQNEDKKVKVSIAYEGKDSLIFLTTEDSRCTLDFRDLVPQDSKADTRYAYKLRYLNKLTRTHCIIFLVLTAFLLFGCAWMYFGLRKKLFIGYGYQTINMELPVSGAEKTVSETTDGWDNSWDDRWDDEEAPKTPTVPATPNLSSRGLASRRLSKEGKEGWKD